MWLSIECIERIDVLLDQVLRDEEACALIIPNQGKFFSNGMVVEYLRRVDNQKALDYVMLFQRLMSKFLTFCLPTIAVIRMGNFRHVYQAGIPNASDATNEDLLESRDRFPMTSGHGYIFMDEVNLGMSLLQGLADIL